MKSLTLLTCACCAYLVCGFATVATAADLYVASGQAGPGELYIINPATGATITDVGPLNDSTGRNFGMTGLAFDPVSGVLYGSSANGNPDPSTRDYLVTIDPATALVTPIAIYSTPAGSMTDLSFDPNTHVLYGIPSVGGASLYKIDPATAQATLVGNSGFTATNGGGLAVSSSSVIYGTPLPANFGTYDSTTGAYTDIANPTKPNNRGYGALAFNGSTLYAMEAGTASHLVTIDTTTGAVTDIGATAAQFLDGMAFKPSAAAGTPGDYNNNGTVDAGDYDVWRKYLNTTHTMPNDPIGGNVGTAQYTQWRSNFGKPPGSGTLVAGSVPEPTSVALLLSGLLALSLRRRESVCA